MSKWKNRASVADVPTGPKELRSTVLSVEEEAIIVTCRKHALLPMDDYLYALQLTIPYLTRSSFYFSRRRHGIGRLPEVEGDKSAGKKFKSYPIGYFHIDIAEVQTPEGKLYLYLYVDRARYLYRSHEQIHLRVGRHENRPDFGCGLPHGLIEAVPYNIHAVLTDNGIQFTFPRRYADGPTACYMTHMFDMRCRENGIEHRLTKVRHPWTNGQVEGINGMIKDATAQRYYYDCHRQFEAHLADIVSTYNFGRELKTLKDLTLYEFICKIWTKDPKRFKFDPVHKMPRLNTASMNNGLSRPEEPRVRSSPMICGDIRAH